jgi:UDP-N-acetyl-D-mannosaminuronate dehydrogenase
VTAHSGDPQRIAIVGKGYVGLPLSMLSVEADYDVVGIDVDPVATTLRWPDSALP